MDAEENCKPIWPFLMLEHKPPAQPLSRHALSLCEDEQLLQERG